MTDPRRSTGTTFDVGRSAAAEFLGTAVFVLVSAGASVALNLGIDAVGAALATGLILGAVVSSIGPLSGGHVNPATTIGLWATGRVASGRALAYIAAQVLGAISGALLLRWLAPGVLYTAAAGGVPSLEATTGVGKGIAIEATVTFILVFAFIATMTDRRGGGSKTAGLTIGLVAAANVMVFGGYTGAAMNPARWLGPAFAAQQWNDWYVWIAGPLIGGLAAAFVYRGFFAQDRGTETAAPED